MKKFIKQQLREGLLSEAILGMADLPESVVLIVDGHNLTLFDSDYHNSKNPVKGILGRISISYENGYGAIEMVAAEKGYGPFMYELAAQYSYPMGIQSDRDGNTNDGALRIWDYFSTQWESLHLSITVEELYPGDRGYCDQNDNGHIEDNLEDYFRLYNTVVYCNDANTFNTLKGYGEEFIENVGDDFRDKIDDLGYDYFTDKF